MADAFTIACNLADRFEGCSLTPYQDPGGVWTIGRGTTIIPGTGVKVCADTPPITQETADEWLRDRMQDALDAVQRLVHVSLNANQFAALADFVYDCGATAFAGSTLLRLLNAGLHDRYDVARCATQFERWVHDPSGAIEPGLVTRRKAEAALFCHPMENLNV